jgi:membrane dipeptidase
MPELDTNFTQSYEEAKEGMVGALLWPISVACGAQYLDAVQLALEGIDEARRLVDRNFGLRIIDNSEQMEQAHNDGMVSVLLGLTGGHALGSSLAVLRMMYSLGARFVSLTALGCATPWADASVKNEIMLEDDITYSLTNFGEVSIEKKINIVIRIVVAMCRSNYGLG